MACGEFGALGFEFGSPGGQFFGTPAELGRGDEVGLVEIGDAPAFGFGPFDAAGELVELGGEDVVGGGWLSPSECLFAGEEHVGAGEHGSELVEDEGVEVVGADATLGAAFVLTAGLDDVVVRAAVVAVGVPAG
ncbi:MAG TPA: hypothetical protein VNF71_14995 [Acidimicrobiales bacterium]|nr:hypothetical protein [Acidimicrobiales bacterium]